MPNFFIGGGRFFLGPRAPSPANALAGRTDVLMHNSFAPLRARAPAVPPIAFELQPVFEVFLLLAIYDHAGEAICNGRVDRFEFFLLFEAFARILKLPL